MERRAIHHIIDFNLKINQQQGYGSSEAADDLINCLRSFKKDISPFIQSCPRDHDYITSSAKMSLMSRVCALGSSKVNMSVIDQVRVLEAGFTGNGPFSEVSFPVYRPVSEDPKFLAACYHVVMNHPGNTDKAANHYLLAISLMGFIGGKQHEDLIKNLEETDSVFLGHSRIDAVYYLIRQIPLNSMVSNESAAVMHDNGGLQRCLELEIDLQELFRRMVSNLKHSGASLTDLAKIHAFCNEVNAYLLKSSMITRVEHQDNASELLSLALDLRKGGDMLLDTSPSITLKNLTAKQVIKIASFSSKRDTVMKSRINEGVFEDRDIKDALQHLDASVQHQVIDRLELTGLYSPRELNLITGKRLELEMGL